MSGFVVNVSTVLKMAEERTVITGGHELLAPTLLRSQTLSAVHERGHMGQPPVDEARARMEWIWRQPIRLLGDAVLRRRARDIAEHMGWADTNTAEYVALTQLQADSSVTLDAVLAHDTRELVPAALFDALS